MPSKSKKQRRFMAAAANNPDFARKAGIKQSVAKEFHNADKRKWRGKKMFQAGGRAAPSMGGGLAQMQRQRLQQSQAAGRKPTPPWAQGGGRQSGMLGALQQAMQRFRGAQGSQGPRPMARPSPGWQSPQGALQAFSQRLRAPQSAPGGGWSRSTSPLPGRQPNALLRTSQVPSGQYAQRLNSIMGKMGPGSRSIGGGRPMFAKGGKVRAIKRLQNAKAMLEDSDPDFDHIASLVDKEIPEAKGLGSMIRKAESRQDWLKVQKKISDTIKALQGTE